MPTLPALRLEWCRKHCNLVCQPDETCANKISPDRYFRSLFLKYWHGRWNLAGIVSFFYKIAGAGKTIVVALFCFATGIALIIFLLRWEYDLAVQPLQDAEHKFEFMLRLRRHQVLIANLMLCLLLIFAILWTRITLQHPEEPAYPVALFLLFLCLVCCRDLCRGRPGPDDDQAYADTSVAS